MALPILQRGSCEPLKAGIHGAALGLFAIMGLYNAAAWLSRHQRHLAVNAVLYSALIFVEQKHVAHHVAALRACRERAADAAARAAAEATAPAAPAAVVPAQFAA
jgi:hypothetical protein